MTIMGCSSARVEPPPFDGERAFSYLVKQVELGPRVPGSAAWSQARTLYNSHFQSLGIAIDSQSFGFFDPYSKTDKPLVNVMARAKGRRTDGLPLLFVAHYDSRPRTDHHSDPTRRTDSLAGANDGASGVAVLMELANLFAAIPPAVDVELLLVDGEDWGEEGDPDHYLLGARYFASQGIHGKYRFGIVIDLVGDRNLDIYRESYSERFNQPLNDMVWETAQQLSLPGFRDMTKHTVLDDHLPINAGGVPAIVLIDFDYPHWHTERDLPENCSAASLAQVGRLLAEIAYNESLWPKK
jgi:hypothetical protein